MKLSPSRTEAQRCSVDAVKSPNQNDILMAVNYSPTWRENYSTRDFSRVENLQISNCFWDDGTLANILQCFFRSKTAVLPRFNFFYCQEFHHDWTQPELFTRRCDFSGKECLPSMQYVGRVHKHCRWHHCRKFRR